MLKFLNALKVIKNLLLGINRPIVRPLCISSYELSLYYFGITFFSGRV